MSNQNRMALAQETLKGGNVFGRYAKRVTSPNLNSDIANNDSYSTKKGKK